MTIRGVLRAALLVLIILIAVGYTWLLVSYASAQPSSRAFEDFEVIDKSSIELSDPPNGFIRIWVVTGFNENTGHYQDVRLPLEQWEVVQLGDTFRYWPSSGKVVWLTGGLTKWKRHP
jgi:hypothetical protein